MTIRNDSLFGAEVTRTQALRAFPKEDGIRPGTLAILSSAATLPSLTPLYFDEAASTWKIWVGDVNEVNTITANATPATAGTFTLTVNTIVSAAIAFNATAAIVQAALEAMSNIAPGDVVAVDSGPGANLGTGSHVVTLTWGGTLAGQDITISIQTGSLTGNAHVLATSTPGGTDPGSGGEIDGFLWCPDDAHVPSVSQETTIQVFLAGSIHRDDIPAPTGTSATDLTEAIRASFLREKNIEITGLSGIH